MEREVEGKGRKERRRGRKGGRIGWYTGIEEKYVRRNENAELATRQENIFEP